MTRLGRSRIPLAAWGLIGLAAAIAATLLVFGGPSRVKGSQFVLHAVFRSQAQLVPRTPVRIAGVRVGQVTSVEPVGDGSDAAQVTMEVERAGLPIHRDATARIRSRLLLEGNYYVELRPGRPATGTLASGATIGAASTGGPVQLDRVLTDLTADTRMSLRTTVQGLGQAIGGSRAGEPASRALHRSLDDWPAALQGVTRMMSALRGEQADDLSGLVTGASRTFGALASGQAQLGELIAGLDTTMAATAQEAQPLSAAIAQLPALLGQADRGLRSLDRALPPTRAFAREVQPGLRRLPATIDAALPWIAQATPLLSRRELGGLSTVLAPTVADTARVVGRATPVVRTADALARCLLHTMLPTGDTVIDEPSLSSGATVSQEFLQTFVGLASAAQDFDGNGRYLRAQTGGGDFPVVTSRLAEQGAARGNAARPPLGTRPATPGRKPPLRTDVPCEDDAVPALNAAKVGVGP